MSFSQSPVISVLMSVHNGEKYLRPAMTSLLQQTFADFELIVVDDGSQDGSPAILQEFAAQDSRVVVVSHENQGLTRSLNVGCQRARGEFIARMDADDVALPRRFEKQVQFLREHPEVVAVGSEVLLMDEQGWLIGPRHQPPGHAEIEARLLAGDGGAMTHPAVLVRATALRQVGGYQEKFVTGQDLDLFLRLGEVGRLANLPEVLLHWRQHRQSVNATRWNNWAEAKRMALTDAAVRRRLQIDVAAIVAQEQHRPERRVEHLNWARRAVNAGYTRTAAKHLWLSLWSDGPKRGQGKIARALLKAWVRGLLPRQVSSR